MQGPDGAPPTGRHQGPMKPAATATGPQGSRLLFYPFAQKEGGSIRCRHRLSKKRLNATFSRLPWRPCAYSAGGEPCREPPGAQGFLRICRTPPGGLLLSLRDNSPCAAKADESLRGGKAERRQWREERGGSPVSKGAPGRPHGPTQRDLCELHCVPEPPKVSRQPEEAVYAAASHPISLLSWFPR